MHESLPASLALCPDMFGHAKRTTRTAKARPPRIPGPYRFKLVPIHPKSATVSFHLAPRAVVVATLQRPSCAAVLIPYIPAPQLALVEPDLDTRRPKRSANAPGRLSILRGVTQKHGPGRRLSPHIVPPLPSHNEYAAARPLAAMQQAIRPGKNVGVRGRISRGPSSIGALALRNGGDHATSHLGDCRHQYRHRSQVQPAPPLVLRPVLPLGGYRLRFVSDLRGRWRRLQLAGQGLRSARTRRALAYEPCSLPPLRAELTYR